MGLIFLSLIIKHEIFCDVITTAILFLLLLKCPVKSEN